MDGALDRSSNVDQRETLVPAMRWDTERPVTLAEHGGASRLVGNDVGKIRAAYHEALSTDRKPSRPELWDGHTAERIAQVLAT